MPSLSFRSWWWLCLLWFYRNCLTVTGITQETGSADSVHFSAWKSEDKICCLGECEDTFQHCCCDSSIVAEEDGGEVVWSADPTRMLAPCRSPELWGVMRALSLRHALGSLSHVKEAPLKEFSEYLSWYGYLWIPWGGWWSHCSVQGVCAPPAVFWMPHYFSLLVLTSSCRSGEGPLRTLSAIY